MNQLSSLFKILSRKLTQKEIREITGISERTQREWKKKGIPKKSKYLDVLKELNNSRKDFIRKRKPGNIKTAIRKNTNIGIEKVSKLKDKAFKIYTKLVEIEIDSDLDVLSIILPLEAKLKLPFLYMKAGILILKNDDENEDFTYYVTTPSQNLSRFIQQANMLETLILNFLAKGYDNKKILKEIIVVNWRKR